MSVSDLTSVQRECVTDLAEMGLEAQGQAVVKFLFTTPGVGQLSVPMVADHTGINFTDAYSVLYYLSGSRANLLSLVYLYIDKDEKKHDLDPEDLVEALKQGKLAHPKSGVDITDFEDSVFPMFRAANRLKHLLRV